MSYVQLGVLILLIHFLADFALQTNNQATKKGEGFSPLNKWLFYHVSSYTLIWSLVFLIIPIDPELNTFAGWLLFVFFIGVPHYIVDWLTSRIGKPFWKEGDNHNGFTVVGFDQVLHYLCLGFILLKYVTILPH